jgi:aspartyl/asparaginyl beta-hydroxylase (cupin superfamily)
MTDETIANCAEKALEDFEKNTAALFERVYDGVIPEDVQAVVRAENEKLREAVTAYATFLERVRTSGR